MVWRAGSEIDSKSQGVCGIQYREQDAVHTKEGERTLVIFRHHQNIRGIHFPRGAKGLLMDGSNSYIRSSSSSSAYP